MASYTGSENTGPRKAVSQRGIQRRNSTLEWLKAVEGPVYAVLARKPEGKI
jgi:hypothetical protein